MYGVEIRKYKYNKILTQQKSHRKNVEKKEVNMKTFQES